MNQLELAIQPENTAFYTENAVILQTTTRIYVQWSININRKGKKTFKNYGKSNKELNALIEKKFQKFVKNKKRRKTEKELQHFQEMQILDDESKKSISSLAESVVRGEISYSSSEWKKDSHELFVTNLSPITFSVILPPKIRGKISTISQINPTTSDENKNSGASIIRKDVLYKHHKILKDKENKWSTIAGTFNTRNNIKTPGIKSFRGNLRKMPFDQ